MHHKLKRRFTPDELNYIEHSTEMLDKLAERFVCSIDDIMTVKMTLIRIHKIEDGEFDKVSDYQYEKYYLNT